MSNDINKIKKLRQSTGAGFKDCSAALQEGNGDIEKAIEILRVKGISKASKKMSRDANEGVVAVSGDEKKLTLIEVNCETDFVAKNDNFVTFVKELSELNLQSNANIDDLKKSKMKNGDTVAIEKESGKVLMYGFNHRYHESIIHMKKLIDKHEYGKVLWMRGRYGKSVDDSFYNNWRAKREFAGGGILIDQGIHMVDLFLYLGGDFDNVHASVSNLYWNLKRLLSFIFIPSL